MNEKNKIIITNSNAITTEADIYNVLASFNFGNVNIYKSTSHLIEVIVSEKITSTSRLSIIDSSITNNETLLGNGNYEYLFNIKFDIYQDELFLKTFLQMFIYYYVRNKNNYKISKFEIPIIGFPNFFTPNNNSYNDTWNILGITVSVYSNNSIEYKYLIGLENY